MPPLTRRLVLPLLLLAAIVGAAAISACGSSDSKDVNEGETVKLGELKYTVSFSRYLNSADNEDAAYLVGQEEPPPGEKYFGIFLEVQNPTGETQDLASEMKITDATEQEYNVVPSESNYAFELGGELEEHEQIPLLDSPGQQDPIQSALAIFLLPEEVSSNRPLLLHIPGPKKDEEAIVQLDL